MFFVAEGPAALSQATGEAIDKFAREAGGEYIGTKAVDHWLIHRNDLCNGFKAPATREYLRENNIFYATTEISANFTDIQKIYNNVMENVPKKIDNLVLLGGHVSHAYQTAARWRPSSPP